MTATPDTFVPRPYPDIVRDVLTTLTGGTVREVAVVPPGDVIVLSQLADRPIRRVSHLQGEIEVQRPVRDANGDVVLDTNGDPEIETVGVPYRFTDADFELFATGAAGDEHDAIRFRPNGRRPPVGSTVTVNYYPTQTRPTPITDLNVGSVARTMLESVARELALVELLMENVYRSAFIDTAEGSNLDKVVALVGIKRRPAGVATTRVRFTRAAGSTGQITIPTATVVADGDGNRYTTVAPLVLEPGEPSREVLAAGVSKSTPAVAANAIDRLEVLIAGIASVTNESPAADAAAAETDDELRRRARGAL
ncbi:MAG TPA: baseplate J/gp47 family protein, partial [Ilumatobacteraceae bacterium]